jgi:hypothetical protein
MGRYYKMPDGTRIQVVGIVEDGKYGSLTEDPQPAMFLPIPAIAHQLDMPGGALGPRSAATGGSHPEHLRNWMPGCLFTSKRGQGIGHRAVSLAWRRWRWACWA